MSDANGGAPFSEPEPEEPEGLYEQLMGLVPRMREELLELDDVKTRLQTEHQAQLAVVEDKKRKITAMLKSLGEEPPRKYARGPRGNSGRQVGNRVLIQVIDAIARRADDDRFSVLDIHNDEFKGEWSSATTYSAIDMLRRHEFIRKAGRQVLDNGHKRDVYCILDRETGERLKKARTDSARVSEAFASPPVKVPSGDTLRKIAEGIKAIGNPEFTILEVNDLLGYASPKNTYSAFRYLRSIGYVVETGKTDPPGGGRHARSLYKLGNEAVLAELDELARV